MLIGKLVLRCGIAMDIYISAWFVVLLKQENAVDLGCFYNFL